MVVDFKGLSRRTECCAGCGRVIRFPLLGGLSQVVRPDR